MIKYASILLGAVLLTACSSEPSDYRPNQKVSTDALAAGTRPTGLYPATDRHDGHNAHAAEGHGSAHGEGHMEGETSHSDASEAAATGAETQKSAVAEPATEHGAPNEAMSESQEPATEAPAGE